MNDLIAKYLISRNLIEPSKDMNQAILDDEALLAEIAGIYQGHEKAVRALIQARIEPIMREIIQNATPAEVLVLRQSMIEVAFLYDDFERYTAEHLRREKAKAEDSETKNDPEVDPLPEEDKPIEDNG